MADDPDAAFKAALKARREVLGDDYVDRALADASPHSQEFQRYLTEFAWSRWARPGLERRERSILVLGMTVALGRMEEFELHLGAALRNGLTEAELHEIVLQVVAYCGAPAGVAARRSLLKVLAERQPPTQK